MKVINLSSQALEPSYSVVYPPSVVMDEIHKAIKHGGVGRLSDLLLQCQVTKLAFDVGNVPVHLKLNWPEVILAV